MFDFGILINYRNQDFSPAAFFPEFAETNALPGAEVHASVGDGNTERASGKHGLEMGRHVVGAFGGMAVSRQVFGGKPVEKELDVVPDIRVEVFANGQSRRGVLNEQVEQSCFRQWFHLLFQNMGNQMYAFGKRRQMDGVLVGHVEGGYHLSPGNIRNCGGVMMRSKGIVYCVLRIAAGYSANARPVRKNPRLPGANGGFNLYINILGAFIPNPGPRV